MFLQKLNITYFRTIIFFQEDKNLKNRHGTQRYTILLHVLIHIYQSYFKN